MQKAAEFPLFREFSLCDVHARMQFLVVIFYLGGGGEMKTNDSLCV